MEYHYKSQNNITNRTFRWGRFFVTIRSKGGELLLSKKYGQITDRLGSILRELREENHLTREQVADRTDIGLRHVAAIELGEKNPSVDSLYRLIRGIGVPSDRIFYPELFEKNPDLDRASRLLVSCTPKQRQLVIAFIEMLLAQKYSEA